MKNTIIRIFLVLILAFFLGCDKKETNDLNEIFLLKFGSECGWCAGQEYITITSTEVNYERNIPCDENKGITTKNRSLSSVEWDLITSSFDYSFFITLEYNHCNVCADGCDEIIKITDGVDSHELRYTPSEEVEGMEDLKGLLKNIMDEMREID